MPKSDLVEEVNALFFVPIIQLYLFFASFCPHNSISVTWSG